MKIVFAGTPEFAAVALEALYAAGHDIVLVLTQPDRPAGRGMKLQASAVKQCALAHQTPVSQPVSLKLNGKYPEVAQQAHEELAALDYDVMVVAAYGLILPESILSIPRYGCLNIHASLLPRWRGAAPIHRAIEAGDQETGVTIMQMDVGLDTGDMLLSDHLPITAEMTTGQCHDALAAMGGELIVKTLSLLGTAALQATPQPDAGVTYAEKISKQEAQLDFTLPAAVLNRKVHAFNPFPGAFTHWQDMLIKVWNAVTLDDEQGQPGEVLRADPKQGVIVACGQGALCITELQKAGGKRLSAADFLQSVQVKPGDVFHFIAA